MVTRAPCDPQSFCLPTNAANKMASGSPQDSLPPAGGSPAALAANPETAPARPPHIDDVFERLDQKLGGSRHYGAFHTLED